MPEALPHDSRIVCLLGLTLDLRKQLLRRPRVHVRLELIGARQEQRNKRLLMIRNDGQNVETDALGEHRLVQQAGAFNLGQRFRDALYGNNFEFEMHRSSYFCELLKMRNIFETGSKKRSTTRSLSGMMTLSVIVMLSGQTFVQHLVILHRPMPNCFRRAGTRSSISSGCISKAAIYVKNRGPMN